MRPFDHAQGDINCVIPAPINCDPDRAQRRGISKLFDSTQSKTELFISNKRRKLCNQTYRVFA